VDVDEQAVDAIAAAVRIEFIREVVVGAERRRKSLLDRGPAEADGGRRATLGGQGHEDRFPGVGGAQRIDQRRRDRFDG
jgi:hypothetical protein